MLRHYQLKCVEAVFREWEKVASTMIVMATGLGKTFTFSEVVRRMAPKRSIVIAHRSELLTQAANHVSKCGLEVQIEKAGQKASVDLFHKSPVVVASVQTLISGKDKKRMEKFDPHDFGLLVIDENHHSAASSYRQIIAHFRKNPDLKVFGCTATPDRSDELALGEIFESVAFNYGIAEAIEDGWLVPIEQQLVRVKSLDYSHVRTTAGDLNGADLAAVMEAEENLQGITAAAIEVIGDRKTIVFTSSVRHAEMCAEIFNRHRSGMAMCISGATPEGERTMLLKDFASGKFQVFVNCSIATEGFDCPDVQCIVMGKPTKSRSLYTQMVGRGTRAIAGVLDDLHSAYERREAIAASRKPSCIVLDFAGNSGRHKLVTTADVLGGKYSDEVKEKARQKAEKAEGPVRMDKLLEESEDEIRKRIEESRRQAEARRLRLVAKADYHMRAVNPFDSFDIAPGVNGHRSSQKQFTEKQRAILTKMGINLNEITYDQGRAIIAQYFERIEKGLATQKQVSLLKRFGYETKDMTMQEASAKIDALKANGWKRPQLQEV